MRLRVLLVALGIAVGAPALGHADVTITGEKLGAFFQITVPTAWNGDLVIWNHGFDFAPPAPNPSLGPLAALQLSEGYAIAATSYSGCCWTLFTTQRDLNRLLGIFRSNFGAPDQVIVTGASLGGIVTAQAVEKLDAPVVGAFPFCGALAGSRNWDGALDLRLAYDAICSGVPGAALPGGATGLPAPGFPAGGISPTALGGAVHTCTGVAVPAAFRTPAQQTRLSQLLAVTGVPESFVIQDMFFVTNGLSNLIWDPAKLDGAQAVGNVGVTYSDAGVNAAIQRVEYDSQARKQLQRSFTPKGDVGATKIVSLHTNLDGLVIVENEKEYRDVVPAANLTTLIAIEASPSHCGFTSGELVASWESLRGWIAGAPQPSAAGIQGLCQALVGGGLAAGPCRIDPAFALADFDTRTPPR